jgi:YHS domain-containing protein
MNRIFLTPFVAMVATIGLASACNGPEQPAVGTSFSVMSTAVAQPATAAATVPTATPAPVAAAKPPSVFDAPQPDGTMATCPVMGNAFAIKPDTLRSEHKGKYVYFCCPGCKPQFDADPAKYLK